MQPKDFSNRSYFPGTTGNPFDILLHKIVLIERIPAILFMLILLAIALVPHLGDWFFSLALFAFSLLDWVLVAILPTAKISFGPVKPTVLLLSFFRAIFALLPGWWSLPFQSLGTLLVLYAFWYEPQRLTISRQRLSPENFHPARPLRLLHIGDLHVERWTNRERRLNQVIRELKPDLILFSGDFLNLSYLRDSQAWQTAREIIQEWQAPLGVYAVSGSPAVDLVDVLPNLLEGLPITWLQDQQIEVLFEDQCLDIIGLNCTHRPFVDSAKLSQLTDTLRQDRFSILLYHSPDLAPNAAQIGINLQLSGHTHGGQIRLPFIGALYAGSLYGKAFEAGRIQVGKMVLYVTRGVGMEGAAAPRVRFLCPPEVILWEIG